MIPTRVDVLIVGAGLSGIDMACRLEQRCRELSYTVLEAKREIGGTWELFRYPGVRSDSDMATFSFPFRPWAGRASMASGADIHRYLRESAAEYGVTERIEFGQRVVGAVWSSAEGQWRVHAQTSDGPVEHLARFLYLATGYYDHERGHVVDLPGRAAFTGRVIHPQFWPEGLDVAGARVVVVGSGATAVTLVPALARRGADVTMLQRSPGYVVSLPGRDPSASALHRLLPGRLAQRLVRWRNLAISMGSFAFLRGFPQAGRTLLMAGVARALPDGFDVGKNFAPRYDPWDERLCVVPDGDLFDALAGGSATIVTDTVETLTSRGIRLRGGGELDADIIVTATGLSLLPVGGIDLEVDGRAVSLPECFVYLGMMLSGVPNAVWCVGYTNASWTLRADLTARTTCRLLRYLHRHGYTVVTPRHDEGDVAPAPLLGLTSGYIRRGAHLLPRQGRAAPWKVRQNYLADLLATRWTRFGDGRLEFRAAGSGMADAATSPSWEPGAPALRTTDATFDETRRRW